MKSSRFIINKKHKCEFFHTLKDGGSFTSWNVDSNCNAHKTSTAIVKVLLDNDAVIYGEIVLHCNLDLSYTSQSYATLGFKEDIDDPYLKMLFEIQDIEVCI